MLVTARPVLLSTSVRRQRLDGEPAHADLFAWRAGRTEIALAVVEHAHQHLDLAAARDLDAAAGSFRRHAELRQERAATVGGHHVSVAVVVHAELRGRKALRVGLTDACVADDDGFRLGLAED